MGPKMHFLRVFILVSFILNKSHELYFKLVEDSNPVVFWSFDESASGDSTSYDSIQDTSIVASGGASFGVNSLNGLGSAASFVQDTSSKLSATFSSTLAPSQGTLLAWVRVDGETGTSRPVISTSDTSSGYVLECTSSNTWAFAVGDGSTLEALEASSDSCTVDEWTFLTATYDSSTGERQLYMNGVWQEASTISGTEPESSASSFSVGGGTNLDGTSGYFSGKIDEVAVLDSVATSCLALELYDNVTSPGNSSSTAYRDYVLSLDPVAYWNFENSSFIEDLTGHDHDGTGSNMCYSTSSATTNLGGSAQFNRYEESSLNMGKSSDWDPEDISVALWIWVGQAYTGTYRPIVGDRVAGIGGFVLECNEDDKFGFYVAYTTASKVSGITSETACTPGEWMFVVATFRSTTREFTFFVNGEYDNEEFLPSQDFDLATTQPLRLGAGYDSTKEFNYFHGKLDEVAIFDWVLTTCEVKAMYQLATNTVPERVAFANTLQYRDEVLSLNPKRYWSFNDISKDGILYDAIEGHAANLSAGICTNQSGPSIQAGYSLQFSGYETSLVAVADSSVFSADLMSIAFWFKSEGDDATSRELLSTLNGYQGFSIHCHTNNYLRFYIGTGSDLTGVSSLSSYCGLNTWRLAVLRYDSLNEEMHMFIDGTLERLAYLDVDVELDPTENTAFKIGGGLSNTHPDEDTMTYWYGTIDEVAVFNHLISTCHIQDLYYTVNGTGNPEYVDSESTGYFTHTVSVYLFAQAYWNFEHSGYDVVTELNQGLVGNITGGACPNRSSVSTELGHSMMFYNYDYGHVSVHCKKRCFNFEQLSFVAWVRSDGASADQRVIGSNFQEGHGFYVECSGNSELFRVNWGVGGTNVTSWSRNLKSKSTCPVGEWHFVSATLDTKSSVATIYVDAVREGRATENRPIFLNTSSLFFTIGGGYEGNKFNAWYGRLDEVAIFDYILTDEEIQILYNRSFFEGEWSPSTSAPSDAPTITPSSAPTLLPTELPTDLPSVTPTFSPTASPSVAPTALPTASPTRDPTVSPSNSPTPSPSSGPTLTPSSKPSLQPSISPSLSPSMLPTVAPTLEPTVSPTLVPTVIPSTSPTFVPSLSPTEPQPTQQPSVTPSFAPSVSPTLAPSNSPTTPPPTEEPTVSPSFAPSVSPTLQPSNSPTTPPPTEEPTESPTNNPTLEPTAFPTFSPTLHPTGYSLDLDIETNLAALSSDWALINITTDFTGFVWYTCMFRQYIGIIDYSYVKTNGTLLSVINSKTLQVELTDLKGDSKYVCCFMGYDVINYMFTHQAAFNGTRLFFRTYLRPTLEGIRFTETGGSILFDFDMPTDKGVTFGLDRRFNCEELFSFEGLALHCTWISSSQVIMCLDADAFLFVGSPVQLLEEKLMPLCIESVMVDCSNLLYNAAGNFTVLEPKVEVVPDIVAVYAPVISQCDNISIDITETTGSGGRDLNVQWDLLAPDNTWLRSYLEEFQNKATLLILQPYLSPGQNYSFNISVENFFGNTDYSVIDVFISEDLPPLIMVDGPLQRSVYRYETLSIEAKSLGSSCASSNGASNLSFMWSSLTDLSLSSVSANERYLRLDPFSLETGNWYTFECAVHDLLTGLSNTLSLDVFVKPAPLSAVFIGGNKRTVGSFNPLLLSVYVQDLDEETGVSDGGSTVYDWECTKEDGDSCDVSGLEGSSVFLATSALSPGTVFTFSVTAYVDGRNATASLEVTVVSGPLPLIDIRSAFPSKVNPDEKLDVYAMLFLTNKTAGSVQSTWGTFSVLEGGFTSYYLSDATSTDISRAFSGRTKKNPHNFVLMADEMVAPSTYTFYLTAYYDMYGNQINQAAFWGIEILTNEPPCSGKFRITPDTGYVTEDHFFLMCSWWVDIDLPLRYTFGYSKAGLDYVLDKSKLSPIRSGLYLPQGTGSNHSVMAVAWIHDFLEASARAEEFVTVYPSLMSTTQLYEKADVLLKTSFAKKDPEMVASIVMMVSSILSSQNCSQAPNCAALNRNPCGFGSQSEPHSCGSCLNGFFSTNYSDQNAACLLLQNNCSNGVQDSSETDLDCGGGTCPGCALGLKCTADVDCEHNFCLDGVCTSPSKECGDNNCGGRGNCTYFDFYGNTRQECEVHDACTAKCVCINGYEGSEGCSYESSEWLIRQDLSTTLITAVVNASKLTDFDSESVNSLSAAILSVLKWSEDLDVSFQKKAVTLLGDLADFSVISGGVDTSSATFLTEAISLLLAAYPMDTELYRLLNNIGWGISTTLVPGEQSKSFSKDNFRVVSTNADILAEAVMTEGLQMTEDVGYCDSGSVLQERKEIKKVGTTAAFSSHENGIYNEGVQMSLATADINSYILAMNESVDSTSYLSGLTRVNIDLQSQDDARRLQDFNASNLTISVNIPHYVPVEYEESFVTEIDIECSEDEYEMKSYRCNGELYFHQCNGTQERGTISCQSGGTFPSCAVWNTDVFDAVCAVDSSSECFTTCLCTLSGKTTTGSAKVSGSRQRQRRGNTVGTTSYLFNQLDISIVAEAEVTITEDWIISPGVPLTISSVSCTNYIVIVTVAVALGLVFLAYIFGECHPLCSTGHQERPSEQRSSIGSSRMAASQTDVEIQLTKGNTKEQEKQRGCLQVYTTLRRKSHWIRLVRQNISRKERVIHATYVVITLLTFMAAVALVYFVAYPNPGPCSSFSEEATCTEGTSPFDSRYPTCGWTGLICHYSKPPLNGETIVVVMIIGYLMAVVAIILVFKFVGSTIARPTLQGDDADALVTNLLYGDIMLNRNPVWERQVPCSILKEVDCFLQSNMSTEMENQLMDLLALQEELYFRKHGDNWFSACWFRRVKRKMASQIRSNLLFAHKAKEILDNLSEPFASQFHMELACYDALVFGNNRALFWSALEFHQQRRAVPFWIHVVGWLFIFCYIFGTCFWVIWFGIEFACLALLWLISFLIAYLLHLMLFIPLIIFLRYHLIQRLFLQKPWIKEVRSKPVYSVSQLLAESCPNLLSTQLIRAEPGTDTEVELQKIFEEKIRFPTTATKVITPQSSDDILVSNVTPRPSNIAIGQEQVQPSISKLNIIAPKQYISEDTRSKEKQVPFQNQTSSPTSFQEASAAQPPHQGAALFVPKLSSPVAIDNSKLAPIIIGPNEQSVFKGNQQNEDTGIPQYKSLPQSVLLPVRRAQKKPFARSESHLKERPDRKGSAQVPSKGCIHEVMKPPEMISRPLFSEEKDNKNQTVQTETTSPHNISTVMTHLPARRSSHRSIYHPELNPSLRLPAKGPISDKEIDLSNTSSFGPDTSINNPISGSPAIFNISHSVHDVKTKNPSVRFPAKGPIHDNPLLLTEPLALNIHLDDVDVKLPPDSSAVNKNPSVRYPPKGPVSDSSTFQTTRRVSFDPSNSNFDMPLKSPKTPASNLEMGPIFKTANDSFKVSNKNPSVRLPPKGPVQDFLVGEYITAEVETKQESDG